MDFANTRETCGSWLASDEARLDSTKAIRHTPDAGKTETPSFPTAP